jgi:hypothetical protein
MKHGRPPRVKVGTEISRAFNKRAASSLGHLVNTSVPTYEMAIPYHQMGFFYQLMCVSAANSSQVAIL